MHRFTVSIDEELMVEFDAFMRGKGYVNRSEAVRDMLRERLQSERLNQQAAPDCIACLSYVYNHNKRELTRRLTHAQHSHHNLTRSTMHVHLDHDHCMEVAVLEGSTVAVKRLAEAIMSETGVRHGRLNLVPVASTVTDAHTHDQEARRPHVHMSPDP